MSNREVKHTRKAAKREETIQNVSSRELVFPEKGDADFGDKLMSLKEYQVFSTPALQPITSVAEFEKHVDRSCGGFEKTIYQHLMQHFLSRRSPYKSLLLYHFLGVGKSCSAITISEALLLDHTEDEEPRIIVISPTALRKNFEEELFASVKYLNLESIKNQCTGDTYRRLVHGIKKDQNTGKGGNHEASVNYRTTVVKRIQQLIKSRYMFVTYAGLVNLQEKGISLTDKVFIIDEAHNLRENDVSKDSAEALKNIIRNGKRNRLVMLSATPMYNEPDEIFWMLSLLLMNDKRNAEAAKVEGMHLFKNDEPVAASFKALQRLSTEYISYIRGNNPFTFPARLKPVFSVNEAPSILNEDWTRNMRDDIITTVAGDRQRIYMIEHNDRVDIGNDNDVDTENNSNVGIGVGVGVGVGTGVNGNASNKKEDAKGTQSSVVKLQLSNITYPSDKSGSAGFNEIFSKVDDNKPIQVGYRSGKSNALMPTDGQLGRIAAKIKRICDIIRTSRGIVVVYSQFVWSGVVPCAIALEHMGFKRHGARNILSPKNAAGPSGMIAAFPDVPAPTYCILSGSDAVMGSTRIEDILPVLNNKNNMHGQQIKVILMTPVAGEGLSFKNVREMHILEPWYHFNKIEQVVGRAIRTCSHKMLLQEERNVTVYLHACINKQSTTTVPINKKKPTNSSSSSMSPDIHAYRISARKLYEMQSAEEAIRDNAIDCALLKNVNYYPRDLFQFAVTMHTSQNQHIPYRYGDNEALNIAPVCTHGGPNGLTALDSRSIRPSIFDDIIGTLMVRLKKYLESHIRQKKYFTVDELIDSMNDITADKNVATTAVMRILYPTILLHGYRIFPHMNGVIVVPNETAYTRVMVKLPSSVRANINNDGCDVEGLIKSINYGNVNINKNVGIYNAYLTINSACWGSLARYMITNVTTTIDTNAPVASVATLFAMTGALLHASELPRLASSRYSYIGYFDIFDTKKLTVILYTASNGTFREATDAELIAIKSTRVNVPKPNKVDTLYGLVEPTQFKKLPNDPLYNQLKLIGTDPKVISTKGAACNTKTKTEIESYLKMIDPAAKTTDKVKEQLCFSLAIELFKKNRIFTYPEWKPAAALHN